MNAKSKQPRCEWCGRFMELRVRGENGLPAEPYFYCPKCRWGKIIDDSLNDPALK